MKVKYDKEVDILYIKINDKPIDESEEGKPGIILDYCRKMDLLYATL